MRVRVTAEDIRLGKRMDCLDCPVARALQRAVGRSVRVYASEKMAGQKVYRLPTSAARFIDQFDIGKKVRPFEFRVTVPACLVRS